MISEATFDYDGMYLLHPKRVDRPKRVSVARKALTCFGLLQSIARNPLTVFGQKVAYSSKHVNEFRAPETRFGSFSDRNTESCQPKFYGHLQ